MASNKTGLNFYRTDTDRYQDMRIKRLKKDFGCSGMAVYDYLLCEIYRVQGCFIVWDENTVFDVAEYFGLKENLVNEIITYCGVVGLFDKGLLCREKIITSRSIQQRYLNMCAAAKRQNVKIPEEIAILPEESPKLPEESTDSSRSLPHSKVEYSKEDNNNSPIIPSFEGDGEFSFNKVWDTYERKGNKKTSKDRWDALSQKNKELALSHIPEYVKATPEKRFRKDFEKYIRQECWNDEIPAPVSTNRSGLAQ